MSDKLILITNKTIPLEAVSKETKSRIINSFRKVRSPLGWTDVQAIHDDTNIATKDIIACISQLLRDRTARTMCDKRGDYVYFKILRKVSE